MKKKIGDCTIKELDVFCRNRKERCSGCPLKNIMTNRCDLDEIMQYKLDSPIEIPEFEEE